MQTPVNPFKQALRERRAQIGLWQGLASAYTAEICAGAGFDWLLVDGEHSPNGLESILQQAQAIAGYPQTHAVARVPMGHGHVGQMLIKQYLDLGIQSLLVPMVDTPEQAKELVRSMRYPPQGVRGMGGARASRWGRYPNYPKEANEQVCLLVQVETREALANLDAIAAVEGVDGVFIGPSDLSASMGHVGNAAHPEVQAAIEDAFARINRAGKAAGILSIDEAASRRYLELGALFVAVGLDNNLLVKATSALAAKFKGTAPAPAAKGGNPY
ncbi:aldolase/citrate lyase family protein [Ramlibacter humi]|uniref:2-dehydro-3-deoxyglucarate aldolase n=1 Tax=Ramlibacter humi TaxID=2530451 RepID=A0A4Z0BR85_9BURK|nr:HpcH/HpaI aldolase/citrate lyase family protein [Ramlibacter humi]TFZ01827.1 2-dehydro-3-deoxyglucarate aldolase [Ramlibacter humi]